MSQLSMFDEPARCRSCSAPVVWTITEKSGKKMPVDAEPVLEGTILLRHERMGGDPVSHVTTKEERETFAAQASTRGEALLLFVSHFATCPNANGHRQPPAADYLTARAHPESKRLHQHSPEIVALPTPGPWKRLSDLKEIGAITVVGQLYWRPTEREVDLYAITEEGLRVLDVYDRGEALTITLRRLARNTDPETSIESGFVSFDRVTRPGGLMHKMLRVFV